MEFNTSEGIFIAPEAGLDFNLSEEIFQDLPAPVVSAASWLDRNSAKMFGLIGLGNGPFHYRNY